MRRGRSIFAIVFSAALLLAAPAAAQESSARQLQVKLNLPKPHTIVCVTTEKGEEKFQYHPYEDGTDPATLCGPGASVLLKATLRKMQDLPPPDNAARGGGN